MSDHQTPTANSAATSDVSEREVCVQDMRAMLDDPVESVAEPAQGTGSAPELGQAAFEKALRFVSKPMRQEIREDLELAAESIARNAGVDIETARAQARAELVEALRLPRFASIYSEYGQAVKAPPRDTVHDITEQAAVMRQPVVRELQAQLLARRESSRGPTRHPIVVASMLQQAFGFGQPLIKESHERLTTDIATRWAYGQTTRMNLKALHEGITTVTDRAGLDAVMCQPAALHMARAIGGLTDEDGNLRYPDFGKRLVVDGTKVESDHSQTTLPVKKNERRNAMVGIGHYAGPKRQLQDEGQEVPAVGGRSWVGYKLVIIADMSTQVPLVWKLMPAGGDERTAALQLLRLLYALWEDCPAEKMVGDALYLGSKQFCHELVFHYGISPVFGKRQSISQRLPWMPKHPTQPGEWGVPICPTKTCDQHLMRRHEVTGIVTPQRRRKEGLKPGEMAPTAGAMIRFRCPKCGATRNTQIAHDPRIYTVYPMAGDSETRVRREAMLTHRNGIESLNSLIKWRGSAGEKQRRCKAASDARVEWHLSLQLLYLVGRRLIHLNGDYEKAREEGKGCGAVIPGYPPRLDEVEWHRQIKTRDQLWGPEVKPICTRIDVKDFRGPVNLPKHAAA